MTNTCAIEFDCLFFVSNMNANNNKNNRQIMFITGIFPEYGVSVYEDHQSDLYDAINRPLEWVSPVPRTNAARVSQ